MIPRHAKYRRGGQVIPVKASDIRRGCALASGSSMLRPLRPRFLRAPATAPQRGQQEQIRQRAESHDLHPCLCWALWRIDAKRCSVRFCTRVMTCITCGGKMRGDRFDGCSNRSTKGRNYRSVRDDRDTLTNTHL